MLSLSALVAVSALTACGGAGGVPDNAVAEVDGEAIEKTTFDHWMTVAAKAGGATSVPKPPEYTACVAQKRKTAPKPAKGQPKPTDKQLTDQCRTEYNGLRDQIMSLLISFRWIEGEAEDQGIKLTDAEVRKELETQKKQSFQKEADFQKFLKDSGQTEADILQRVRLQRLSEKIRDKVTKGKDKVTDAQIKSYYDKNKARFAQPERRDIRLVLTDERAQAAEAKQALQSGQSWKTVAKQYSTDDATKTQGGRLPAVVKGQQEAALDDAVFGAEKGKLTGPVKTGFGYYVFEVTGITEATQQSLKDATPTIRQLVSADNQQKALDSFVKQFRADWKEKTECGDGFKISDCKNGPKATPTPAAQTPATPGQ